MSYKLDSFLVQVSDTDRLLKIKNSSNVIVHTINGFSITSLRAVNNIVQIITKSNKIELDFSTTNEARIALSRLQQQIDLLKDKYPLFIDKEIENYFESVTQGPQGKTGPQGYLGITGAQGPIGHTGVQGKLAKFGATSSTPMRDGISSIESLIKDKDYEAIGLIKQYNLELNTVLEKGEFISLKRRNNASAGGTTIGLDIDLVHQDNINLCLKVADIFSLNMVGVDLIIPDISKSWMEVGCLVCDVNGIPQIGYEYVAKPIMEDLFKLGSRIPAYLLIVNNLENLDISTIANIIKCDGISSANGIWVNNKLISNNFNNGFEAAIALLFDRNINRALCILTDKGILQFGLPLDKFDGIFIQKDILQIEMLSQILKNSKNIIEI